MIVRTENRTLEEESYGSVVTNLKWTNIISIKEMDQQTMRLTGAPFDTEISKLSLSWSL